MIDIFAAKGDPLPASMPYTGQWIIENRMFLYVPSPAEYSAGNGPRMTVTCEAPDGAWAIGFDAQQIAAQLSVSVETILAANQDHTFTWLHMREPSPDRTIHIFEFRGETLEIVVADIGPTGTA